MAEIITIATRRISGTGLILPTTPQLKYRRYTLFADIIRKPRTPYINTDTKPPETYYGVISLIKDGYVLQTFPIRFDAEIWNFDADISGQTLIAIKCEYLGILESFVNLGTALGLTVTSVENTIANYKNLPLQWDAIYIKCFADCAIQFVLKGTPYDACTNEDKEPQNPPPPPPKPIAVPPGVGTSVDNPYPGDPITDPTEIDKNFIPPPIGNDCQIYTLRFDYTYQSTGNPIQSASKTIALYGPVSPGVRKKAGEIGVIETQHRGFPAFQGCQSYGYKDVESVGDFNIISISNVTIT